MRFITVIKLFITNLYMYDEFVGMVSFLDDDYNFGKGS